MSKAAFPDARTLLILVLILTTLAIAMADPLWLGALLLAILVILAVAGVPLGLLVRRLQRYRWLFFLLALIQSITNSSGQIFLEFQGYVLLSSGGLLAALAVVLRIAVILAAALLLSLRNYQELVTGLVQMKVPYELAYMVLLGVRFIPVLMEEFRDALTAIQLRGIDLERIPLKEKVRVYSFILMPTVAGAVIRARRIATAMDARAFRANRGRTWLDWPRFTGLDWLVASAAVFAGAMYWIIYRGWIL